MMKDLLLSFMIMGMKMNVAVQEHGVISDCCVVARQCLDCYLCIHDEQDLEKKREKRIKQCSLQCCVLGCGLWYGNYAGPDPCNRAILYACHSCGVNEVGSKVIQGAITGACWSNICTDDKPGCRCGINESSVECAGEICKNYVKCCDKILNEGFADQCGSRPERLIAPRLQEIN